MDGELGKLAEDFKAGKKLALARAISLVEGRKLPIGKFIEEVSQDRPHVRRIGVTGPPGAGKSTLIASLASLFRSNGEQVGILAVDPTSPFSGGALLGDRVRMNDLSQDPGVFIRSVASRGSVGGLSSHSEDIIELMGAFGLTRVIVETVGVGQTELEVSHLVDSVIVLLVPESGDGVQMMKAGLLEIADIFTINKSDRPGADLLLANLEVSLQLSLKNRWKDENRYGWKVPVVKTVATLGEGVQELLVQLNEHHEFLKNANQLELFHTERMTRKIRQEVTRHVYKSIWEDPEVLSLVKVGLAGINAGETTAYAVSQAILERFENCKKS